MDIGVGGLVIALDPRLVFAQMGYDPIYGAPIKWSFKDHAADAIKFNDPFKFLGIDYYIRTGTIVVATADGPILNVEDRKIGGPTVWQDHGDAYVSFYTHLGTMDNISVKIGQNVKRGEAIAKYETKVGVDHFHYGFGRLYSGQEVGSGRRAHLWLDANTLGDNGGRLRLPTGDTIDDIIPKESRVYYHDLVQRARAEFKGGDIPKELNPLLEENRYVGPSELSKLMKDHAQYFNEGTRERFIQRFRKMTNPNSSVPVVLTHPLKNPASN